MKQEKARGKKSSDEKFYVKYFIFTKLNDQKRLIGLNAYHHVNDIIKKKLLTKTQNT